MGKVVLEAGTEPSSLLPLLFIVVAALVLVGAIFVLRYRRKGDK